MFIFQGSPVVDPPADAIGFIYRIVHQPTGKFYIGRKLLHKKKTRQVKGKKKSVLVESDWRTYFGSSPALLGEITLNGPDQYTREILTFVNTRGALMYAEELALFLCGALERDDCYNGNIRSKIMRSWIYGKLDTAPLRAALSFH